MYNNTLFMNNTETNFLNEAREKKIIIWGAGTQTEDALKRFIYPNRLKISYVVDNDYHKWYGKIYGIEIRQPSSLKYEEDENTLVLITSQFPYRIESQIKNYGINNYYSWHLFLEEHIGRYQFMVFF